MRDKRFWAVVMGVFIFVFFIFVLGFVNWQSVLTGYVIFSDGEQADFDGGVYTNTVWNGSAVVLSGDNLSGSFESRVFDSGIEAGASWNNLSWVGGVLLGLSLI